MKEISRAYNAAKGLAETGRTEEILPIATPFTRLAVAVGAFAGRNAVRIDTLINEAPQRTEARKLHAAYKAAQGLNRMLLDFVVEHDAHTGIEVDATGQKPQSNVWLFDAAVAPQPTKARPVHALSAPVPFTFDGRIVPVTSFEADVVHSIHGVESHLLLNPAITEDLEEGQFGSKFRIKVSDDGVQLNRSRATATGWSFDNRVSFVNQAVADASIRLLLAGVEAYIEQ